MSAQTFRKIHEARIDIINDEKVYVFLLCNGDMYRFVIPSLDYRCEGGE